jgi:signal transduction histidine kinase/ActR/RegA family two-component response regulator
VGAVGPGSQELAARLGLTVGEPLRGERHLQIAAVPLIYEPDTRDAGVPVLQRMAEAGLHSVALAPLVVDDQVMGVLIAARRDASAFSSPACELLRQLGEHVALATHQARLHSELRRAYEDLRHSQQTVLQQERLRALGEMASGIAHDINNAISPVSLYTEALLERETSLSPRAREYLTTIQRAIDDVAGTVARMREFYRHRETQLTLARVDVNKLVEQVLQLTEVRWSNLPQERGIFIDLRTELAPGPLHILAAEGELRDALTNLVFNAVDAMPEGGVLTVRTLRIPASGSASPRIAIEVSDTGIGMDEETRRRCLEPFFTTKGERGTGLGLAMVYGAIQRHSAELTIDSTPGQGSTFRIAFDDASAVSVPDRDTLRVKALAPPQRILLVDDDPVLVRSLCDILEADGHEVFTTSGGEGGIEAFRTAMRGSSPFGLVITDLGMPHVDGRRVAAAVKALSPATPVLMLTGWGQRMLADNDIPPHVDALLSKPPRVAELRAAILRVLPGGTRATPEAST